MRSLKNHLSVILPIAALLFAIQFSRLSDNAVKEYERRMSEDYNIVIVSQKDLNATALKPLVSDISSLEPLSPKGVLERLSKDISAKNIEVLQAALPKFYSLKLNSFPTAKQIENLKTKILKADGVSRVETFSKTHDKVYKILKLIENISRVFAAIIAAIGVTLLFKQMRIWLYEHKERIDIMTLFGAPFWLKSAALFKIAVFDSVFAAILVIAFYSALPGLNLVNTSEIGVDLPTTDLLADGAKLIGVSLILAAVSVILVMRRAKRDDI